MTFILVTFPSFVNSRSMSTPVRIPIISALNTTEVNNRKLVLKRYQKPAEKPACLYSLKCYKYRYRYTTFRMKTKRLRTVTVDFLNFNLFI